MFSRLISRPVPGPAWALSVAAIVLAVLATFSRGLGNGFVCDDIPFILRNAFVHDLGNLPRFFLSGDATGTGSLNPYYRPLTTATFAIDYALWGERAAGYHATNILLHLATSIAVFFTARNFTKHSLPALAAALLFSVHPAHAEPVGYISARADLLCAFFMLCAFLGYLRYLESDRRGNLVLSLGFFSVALLSKIVAMALPPLLALHLALLHRGRRRWNLLIPYGAICLAFLAARSWVLKLESWGGEPLKVRVINSGIHLVAYLKNAFVPIDLKVFYDLPLSTDLLDPDGVTAWIFLVTLGVAVAVWSRPRPALAFGAGWFLAGLVPVCGIVMFLFPARIADRYLYIPMIGLALALAVLLEEISSRPRIPRTKAAASAVVACCILACSLGAAGRLENWRDPLTYWKTAARDAPRSAFVRAGLGSALQLKGMQGEAELSLKMAIALDDTRAVPHLNLTVIDFARGNREGAERHNRRALELEPSNPVAVMHLGIIKAEKGMIPEAAELFREALRMNPYYEDARINLEKVGGLPPRGGG